MDRPIRLRTRSVAHGEGGPAAVWQYYCIIVIQPVSAQGLPRHNRVRQKPLRLPQKQTVGVLLHQGHARERGLEISLHGNLKYETACDRIVEATQRAGTSPISLQFITKMPGNTGEYRKLVVTCVFCG